MGRDGLEVVRTREELVKGKDCECEALKRLTKKKKHKAASEDFEDMKEERKDAKKKRSKDDLLPALGDLKLSDSDEDEDEDEEED